MGFLSFGKQLTEDELLKEARTIIIDNFSSFNKIRDRIQDKALSANERKKILDEPRKKLLDKIHHFGKKPANPSLLQYYEGIVDYSLILNLIHTDLENLARAKDVVKEELEKNIASFLSQAHDKIVALNELLTPPKTKTPAGVQPAAQNPSLPVQEPKDPPAVAPPVSQIPQKPTKTESKSK